jgi:hypothetical protein
VKYIYKVDLAKMEATYLENAQRELFDSNEQRNKFNAELIIEADNEDEALQMRIGMTDIRMWDLDHIEP